ncbi:4Fe-4S ferredoxin [Deltaproteobacteria bacterium Smac51]|nr:4Fe-4S ferredoxin [Deltaproteobacteria bacterium Smac51]
MPTLTHNEYLEALVHEFMGSPANDNAMPTGPEAAFDTPLIGFAAGGDPIWEQIKAEAATNHWTPLEAFRLAYPEEEATADDLSVVSWVLPQTAATREDQRRATLYACERWIRNRYVAQVRVVDELARFVIGRLDADGVKAASPDLLPEWKRFKDEKFTISSLWSHRHAAFAAGLGTFGLSDGLITKAGKAMRCGSVVVRLKARPTPRPYSGYNDYCLFYNSGLCGKCVKRCPCEAITLAGHDKNKCSDYLDNVVTPAIAAAYPDIAGAYGCGLCQAAVPCENSIPPRPPKSVRRELEKANI